MFRNQLHLTEIRLSVFRVLRLLKMLALFRLAVPLIILLHIINFVSFEQFLRRLSALHKPLLPGLNNLFNLAILTHFIANFSHHSFIFVDHRLRLAEHLCRQISVQFELFRQTSLDQLLVSIIDLVFDGKMQGVSLRLGVLCIGLTFSFDACRYVDQIVFADCALKQFHIGVELPLLSPFQLQYELVALVAVLFHCNLIQVIVWCHLSCGLVVCFENLIAET